MWATLALMTALNLTPAETGGLELKNVRPTYGILGQERKDTTFLPGDMFWLSFDIEGLTVGKDGLVRYQLGLEVVGKDPDTGKLKTWFKQDPENHDSVNTLGGGRRPEFALTQIGTDTPPGKYTTHVTVIDRLSKKTATLKRTFEVKPTTFGFVRLGFLLVDESERGRGQAVFAPPLGVPGQTLLLNFTLVGFELKGDAQQPNVSLSMKILDESGEPTLKQPITATARNIEDAARKVGVIPMNFPVLLNRTGKFKIVLTAKDEFSKKTAEQTLELKVVDLK